MKKLVNFVLQEKTRWPAWWDSLSPLRKYGLAGFFVVYWSVLALLGDLHNDHILIGAFVAILSVAGPAATKLLRFLFPFMLTGIVYDSMRYYSDYIRGEVHVAFPYDFDKRFFGIETAEGRLTPNEWWQKHTTPLLDFITGFFYLAFITIYAAISAYHALVLPWISKDPVQRMRANRIGPYVTWAFFWLNIIGYSTYYWFPAAPPWYVAEHGMGPAQMNTLASPAGAIRFDQLLGTHFFTGMYGRSADVFGAIPSLHVAYPLLSVLFAFQLGSLRVVSIVFYVVMCFSAVYLNHHYIIDILWGSVYAVLVFLTIQFFSNRKPTEVL